MRDINVSDIQSTDHLFYIDLFWAIAICFLIVAPAALFDLLASSPAKTGIIPLLGQQFHHTPWEGRRLFDFGQLFFMFISGVAMVFSYHKSWSRGETWESTLLHCLFRAGLLFLLGWALLHLSSADGATQAELFMSVLSQLAVASGIAFLLLKQFGYVQI